MMYFDEAEQKRLMEKFYRCLNPDGYLFVGHAESLFGLTDKFKMVHQNNGTAYQRIEVGQRMTTSSRRTRPAELRELFFESAQELLQTLNEEALKLEKAPGRRGNRARHPAHGAYAERRFRGLRLYAN